jgi:hypothetical protein
VEVDTMAEVKNLAVVQEKEEVEEMPVSTSIVYLQD